MVTHWGGCFQKKMKKSPLGCNRPAAAGTIWVKGHGECPMERRSYNRRKAVHYDQVTNHNTGGWGSHRVGGFPSFGRPGPGRHQVQYLRGCGRRWVPRRHSDRSLSAVSQLCECCGAVVSAIPGLWKLRRAAESAISLLSATRIPAGKEHRAAPPIR